MRECEIKFQIHDASSALDLTERLLDLDGTAYTGSREELDCVVDTEDHAMRAAGVLLRHRVVRRKDGVSELITLKTARPETAAGKRRFQDHEEIEFEADGSERAARTSFHIGDEVRRLSGVSVEVPRSPVGTRAWLTTLRAQIGSLRVRALLEKRRSVFKGEGWEVCLDRFPSPMGSFAEIEATDPGTLLRVAGLLHLDPDAAETRTYGKILGERNARRPPALRRVALFDDSWGDLADVLELPAR
ncbi:CYTH domain-containing protein [Promicromonospora sp. NPDC060204]|uniref:CYTH domain-containing protein n=1 Tax=Promicromonospora sp. NPDC060204 TaxID=3347071 RepID=UPI00364D39B6